jgi:GNAT superfamily N-acetyltransferase
MSSPGELRSTRNIADQFPAELVCDVQTLDGAIVHMRPIRPEDGARLMKFHEGLSSQSVYRRFFYMHPRLSSAEIERFTHVDYVDRLALVVVDGDRLVAVGRYERIPETADAEVAFVVADAFQHHGIGTLLLEHLAGAAVTRGITTFVAQTLMENHDMLDVFMRSGFTVTTSSGYGTVSLRFSIKPDESSRLSSTTRPDHGMGHRRDHITAPPC